MMFTHELCRGEKLLLRPVKTLLVFSFLLVFALLSPSTWAAVQYLGRDYADSTSENTSISFTATVPADATFLIGIAHSSRGHSPTWMGIGEHVMTRIDGLSILEGSRRVGLFMLVDPPKGSQPVGVQYDGEKKRGKIASVIYYKGVDLTNPFGRMMKESSGDPFQEAGNVITPAELPRGSEVITAITGEVISALNGRHFGDANIDSFEQGGGTAVEIFNARPRRSAGVDYLCTGAVYRVYGTFTSNVRPEWDRYDGSGAAVAGVINPAPMDVTYVSNPAPGGTFNGPNKIAEVTGSIRRPITAIA